MASATKAALTRNVEDERLVPRQLVEEHGLFSEDKVSSGRCAKKTSSLTPISASTRICLAIRIREVHDRVGLSPALIALGCELLRSLLLSIPDRIRVRSAYCTSHDFPEATLDLL